MDSTRAFPGWRREMDGIADKTDRHIGLELDGYRVESLIGRGGMGAVYKGTDLSLHRPVAIRVLEEGASQDPESVLNFEREEKRGQEPFCFER